MLNDMTDGNTCIFNQLTEEAVGVNGHLTRLELKVRPWAGDIASGGEVGPISQVRPVIAHRNVEIVVDVVVACCLIEHNQAGELVGILTLSSPGLLNLKHRYHRKELL